MSFTWSSLCKVRIAGVWSRRVFTFLTSLIRQLRNNPILLLLSEETYDIFTYINYARDNPT